MRRQTCNEDVASPTQDAPGQLVESGGNSDKFEDRLRSVLDTYNKRGALDADNALDSVEAEFRKAGKKIKRCISALQTIFRSELGLDLPRKADKIVNVNTLETAICAMYHFMCCLKHDHIQAANTASHLLEYHKNNPSVIPQKWMEKVADATKKSPAPYPIAADSDGCLTAAERWKYVVHKDCNAPSVMADVLRMVGIEEVKDAFVRLYHRAQVAKVQGDRSAFSYNACFVGNPGTGKTTIARYYCDFLKQLKVLPENSVCIEISGSSLSYQGIAFLDKTLDEVKKVQGGVIFIDEAYQLLADREGLKVLDFILPLAEGLETKHGSVAWVLAGYSKDMEKLMAHNVGMASRFPTRFVFKDYSDEGLMDIFQSLLIHEQASPKTIILVGKPTSDEVKKDASVTSNLQMEGKKLGNGMDRFGNKWTFDGKLWHDEFGSSSGYGPASVGEKGNPLISADFKSWTYDVQTHLWQCSSGDQTNKYPGNAQKSGAANFRKNPFQCENEKYIRIAMRRLGRQRSRIGFGNARAVQAYFDQVRSRQAERIRREEHNGGQPDVFLFKREDLLGPRVTEVSIKSCKAYRGLQALEGLDPVKKAVDDMITLAVKNALREEEEKPILDIVINRIFLGNPGTGKTTVAKLYGQLLVELGLLSKGRVIIKNPSDFVGSVLGSSEKQTRDILRLAEGCVLVIDEAYSFYSGSEIGNGNSSYNTAVINTIVEQVQATPGDDRAVILLGYQEEMEIMLKNVNPGLSRRFQIEFAFRFPDYDDQALLRILLAKVRRDNLKIDFQVAKQAIASLSEARSKSHFGNAGAVENLLSEAKIRSKSPKGKLVLSDFGIQPAETQEIILSNIFDDLIGCEEIKSKLALLQSTVLFAKRRGEDPKEHVCYNYLFLGNSGTGKTTVAMRMGKMFKALGLLPDATVHSISPSDFLTGFIGQTAKKTREILQRSKGSVLLIDEAYQLDSSRGASYMPEAVDELVRCLTCPEFEGKMLIILAGYHNQMNQMLATNQGLKSRFAEQLHFEDLNVQQTVDLMLNKLKSRNFNVDSKDHPGLADLARRLVASPGFANGRDINNWSAATYQQVASKLVGVTDGNSKYVTLYEIEYALELILQKRKRCAVEEQSSRDALGTKRKAEDNIELEAASSSCSKMQISFQTQSLQENEEARVEADSTASIDTEGVNSVSNDMQSTSFNPFQGVNKLVLGEIQNFLELNGLNNEQGVSELSRRPVSDKTMQELISRLTKLGMIESEILSQVTEWQNAQKILTDRVEEHKRKSGKLQPIWRCAVCGRADMPWIVCYVAPYILRYEQISN